MSGAICLLFFFFPHLLAADQTVVPRFDAKIELVNFGPAHAIKVRKAVEIIKRVVKSDEFKRRVLQHTYDGKLTFVDNLGLTNEEIYQRILEGAEQLQPERNGRMDVQLELFHQDTATIGYTYPNTRRIWVNRKYFNSYTPIQVADNLFHEWLHKLGFDHSAKYSISRKFSVPYALGYLIEELALRDFKTSENLISNHEH